MRQKAPKEKVVEFWDRHAAGIRDRTPGSGERSATLCSQLILVIWWFGSPEIGFSTEFQVQIAARCEDEDVCEK